MKLHLKIFVVVCLLTAIFQSARAQNAQRVGDVQSEYDERFMVSLVPLPLAFNGFRFDFDSRLKDNLWLQLAPQYNYKRKGANIKIDGLCFEANMRYYAGRSSSHGFYVASGLGADYNRIQDVITETAQGNPEEEIETPYKLTALRVGGQLQVGYSFGLWPGALLDVYAGAAFRHSFNSFSDEASRTIVENGDWRPWHYHFSGLFMQAGIRLGMQFGK